MLGDNVKVARDKTKIVVTSEIAMSKRYLKYLTKKYLKKVGGSWQLAAGAVQSGQRRLDTSSEGRRQERRSSSACSFGW